MKICFLCNEYPPARHGGIGSMTRTLGRALVEVGHHVRVIGVTPADDAARDFESDGGVLVWRLRLPASRLAWIRARYLIYRTVERWARSGLIDLVEVPDYEGMAAGWPALRVPVIARLNGSSSYFAVEMGKRPKPATFFLERASLRRANFHCSSGRYVAHQTRSLFRLVEAEMAVLYNPVTIAGSLPGVRRSFGQVVFSGTLTPKKGVISLIRAWPMVVRECPRAELNIFGKDGRTDSGGSMQDYLISCLPPQIRDTVYFYGHVDFARLQSAFQSATVAVFPSHSEAFALAPMEAMAEACPTVYTRRASGPELIDDGENGLLVDPDDPRDIAGVIVRILKDANLAHALGSSGRKCIERRFSVSALVPQNINFYLECIRSFSAPALSEPTFGVRVSEKVGDQYAAPRGSQSDARKFGSFGRRLSHESWSGGGDGPPIATATLGTRK